MPIYLNESLRQENMTAVFCAVADSGCETRAEIAAETGLSIVTVGKAAEAFLDVGLFQQKMSQKKGIGRKASRLLFDTTRVLVVLDISGSDMVMTMFNMSFEQVESTWFHEMPDFSFRDNLRTFLYRVKAYMLSVPQYKYMAIGLVVPGRYDKATDSVLDAHDGFCEMRLREFIKQVVGMPINMIIDGMTASMRYCLGKCQPSDNILLVSVSQDVGVRLAVGGKQLRGCSSVRMELKNDIPGQVADIVACVAAIVNLSSVFVQTESCPAWMEPDGMRELITQRLTRNCEPPQLTVSNNRGFSQRGGALVLRRVFIERLMR